MYRVQVYLGPGFSGSGSRVQVQVLEAAINKLLDTEVNFLILSLTNFWPMFPPKAPLKP